MWFEKKIEDLYKKKIFVRCDNPLGIFYFSHKDFENLKMDEYEFSSSKNYKLQGYFYYYPNYIEDKLIIFDHGFGNGHKAYMKEIEILCRNGYKVFTYDHSGCMNSEGESTNGFAQSLVDLNDAFISLKNNDNYKNLKFMVMGHSWGAFASLNIISLHSEIEKVVALSGFLSVDDIINQNFSSILTPYKKNIYALEEKANKNFIKYNAINSIKNSSCKVLAIYSDNDPILKKKFTYTKLKKNLGNLNNLSLHLEKKKFHNPNYTREAVLYMNNFSKELSKNAKNSFFSIPENREKFMSKWDWNKMTEQDEVVWNKILSFLND